MSRIGKLPVEVPKGVNLTITPELFTAKGPKGEVSVDMLEGVTIREEANNLLIERADDSRTLRACHGLIRSLVNNAVTGVSTGFVKKLEINGIGYKAEVKGSVLEMELGFSHTVYFDIPKEVTIEIENRNIIVVSGCNKQIVGQVAADIRAIKKPEPYKGKGIKYVDEVIKRKIGKVGA